MTAEDSPLYGLYPDDFEIDMNGKTAIWEGICLIPFIHEQKLKKAVSSIAEKEFTVCKNFHHP